MPKHYTLNMIAENLGEPLTGNGDMTITRLAHPADIQGVSDLVLAMDKKLLPLLKAGQAKAVIVGKDAALPDGFADAIIQVSRPRLALAKLTALFAEETKPPTGIHQTAVVEDGAVLGRNVTLGAFCYVAKGARVGDNCILYPQTFVGAHAVIGDNSTLHAGVKIGEGVKIGTGAIIHFNASIGADGFSYVTPEVGSVEAAKESGAATVSATNKALLRIASLGGLIIGNDVEIGANTTIDRGTIAPTRIGNGTKIDNQVQIGHNVTVGDNCLICGRVGIAGSANIGNRVVLGGAVGVADHVTVADDAIVMAMSGVAGNVPARTIVGGLPATSRERMMENHLNLNRLKQFFRKIEGLDARLNQLEQTPKND